MKDLKKHIKKFLLYYFLISIATVIVIGLIIAMPLWEAGPPVEKAHELMDQIEEGNFEEAYYLTSFIFRDYVTRAEMEEYLRENPVLVNEGELSFYTKQVKDGFAKLGGHKVTDAGITQVNVQLVFEENQWKILGFDTEDPMVIDDRTKTDIIYYHFK